MARDGVEALEMLRELPRPYLIITDINMPRMNGIELLRKIRESEEFRDSIVFVLTTSNDEQDKIDAYDLNVAGYMLKTDMGTSFSERSPDRQLLESRRVPRAGLIGRPRTSCR